MEHKFVTADHYQWAMTLMERDFRKLQNQVVKTLIKDAVKYTLATSEDKEKRIVSDVLSCIDNDRWNDLMAANIGFNELTLIIINELNAKEARDKDGKQ